MNQHVLREILRETDGKEVDVERIKPKFLTKEEREKIAADRERQINERRQCSLNCSAMEVAPVDVSPEDRMFIKKRYFGNEPRKLRKSGERRVNFDWDETEDTSLPHSSAAKTNNPNPTLPPTKPMTRVIKTIDQFGNEVEIVKNTTDSSFSHGGKSLDERHWSEKRIEEMEERDWRIFKEDFNISTSGGVVPHPIRFWDEAPLSSKLIDIVFKAGYDDPTPIQRQAIPIALEGRDVLGVAETGSGKTAAFLLPIINKIMRLPPFHDDNILDGPYALIMAPTRELALQIEQEAKKFCRLLNIRCMAIVGGHSMTEQSFNMRNGVEIVIATPGRLRDCLEQRVLVLNQCHCLVLDEADRMIDMNFEEDLKFILDFLPTATGQSQSQSQGQGQGQGSGQRQTTMFSATMPPSVEKLARLYLHRPAMVTVGQAGQVAETVEQRVELLKDSEKDSRLLEILNSPDFVPPIIIFVSQKKTVDFLSRRLETLGYRCTALHGGKNQEQRESAISQLKKSGRDILIATDVAGRGIDIKDVSLVINYDMAKSIEDYTHRVGRTGRMGKRGVAITFLTIDDADIFYDLRVVLQRSPKSVIPAEFLMHEAARVKPGTVTQKKRHQERIYAYGV